MSDQDVERQTEIAHSSKLWTSILHADFDEVKRLVKENPEVARSRGPVGETPLHLLFLYHSPQHIEIAKWLLDLYPDLILDEYEGAEYKGENVLHIAIVHKDIELVKWLLGREKKLLHSQATGNFFKRGSPCYFGEYPLFFAASTNQKEVLDHLIENGADLFLEDSNKNNLLHLMIEHDLVEMYDYIESKCSEIYKTSQVIPLSKRRNQDDQTPLIMAATFGKGELLSHIIENEKQVQWIYGPIACMLYPCDELNDTLQAIVDKEHSDLLVNPRIIELLKKKWERFAKGYFYSRFIFSLFFLMVFFFVTVNSPVREEETKGQLKMMTTTTMLQPFDFLSQYVYLSITESYQDLTSFLIVLSQMFLITAVSYKCYREMREMINNGLVTYFSGRGSQFLENSTSLTFCLLYLVHICVKFSYYYQNYLNNRLPTDERVDVEDYSVIPLSLSGLFGWAYLLFFFLGFKNTGPFVVMIYKMLMKDIARFTSLFLVFLLGFAQSFYVLFSESGWLSFASRVRVLFNTMLGGLEFEPYIEAQFPVVAVPLIVAYVLLVGIMLLNLLIAMMGDTYAKISEDADKQWYLEWARIILSIESEMESAEKESDKNKYWTLIGGKKYLQVQEVNQDYFNRKSEEGSVIDQVANLKEELEKVKTLLLELKK